MNTARQLEEIRRTRAAAIRELRLTFERYGSDVSAYDDDEVSAAVLAEANSGTCCSWDLFLRAFARLQQRGVTARESEAAPAS